MPNPIRQNRIKAQIFGKITLGIYREQEGGGGSVKTYRSGLLLRKRVTDARIRELESLVTRLMAEAATLGFESEELEEQLRRHAENRYANE